MKAINASAKIIDMDSGCDVLKKIEYVGRTCYKSTDKITAGSAEKFVGNLVKSGHEAMLEHGSFIFRLDYGVYCFLKEMMDIMRDYGFNIFLHMTMSDHGILSGNVRAFRDFFKALVTNGKLALPSFFQEFVEKNQVLFPEPDFHEFTDLDVGSIHEISIDDLKTEDELLTHCNVTVKFVVDRGVSHEIVRHRPASFAQESTRYCNYTKDKFGKELTFIAPFFWDRNIKEFKSWVDHMEAVEDEYFYLIDDCGCTPEEARTVLPNCLKTEVIMTANLTEWHHFFELRACDKTGKAHPQIKEVSVPLLDEFKNNFNYIFDDLVF